MYSNAIRSPGVRLSEGYVVDVNRPSLGVDARVELLKIVAAAVVTSTVSIVVGLLLKVDFVRTWHESTFDPIVEWLQASSLLIDASRVLTDLGHFTVNYLMLAVLAVVAWLRFGRSALAWWVGLALTAVGLRPFQSLVSRLVDGSSPASSAVIGTSGPYFSGGVFRVVVISALAGMIFQLRSRTVLVAAVLAGVVEGLTRMVLGRHWPLDIVAAIPIGLVVAAIVGRTVAALTVVTDQVS